MIGQWIGDDQKPWFTESWLNLIGEGTRSETASNWCCLGVMGELQYGTLTVWAAGDGVDLELKFVFLICLYNIYLDELLI